MLSEELRYKNIVSINRKETIASTIFTIKLVDQDKERSTMLDLYHFVKEQVTTDKHLAFWFDGDKLQSSRHLKSGVMEKTRIEEFIKLERMKQVF